MYFNSPSERKIFKAIWSVHFLIWVRYLAAFTGTGYWYRTGTVTQASIAHASTQSGIAKKDATEKQESSHGEASAFDKAEQ